MTFSDERVASEMGRALMAIYRAGLQVRVWPDALHGRAAAPGSRRGQREGGQQAPLVTMRE